MAIDRSKMQQTDAKGKVTRDAKKDVDTAEGSRFYWWKADEKSMAQEVASTIKFIQTHQPGRLQQLTDSARLYGTSDAMSLLGVSFTRASAVGVGGSHRISFNLCQSVVDTLQAKMAKNKVTPTFVTQGGIWSMQKKARDITKFIEGCFYQNDMHRKGTVAYRDAGIWGTGIVHIYRNEDDICVERAFPHELWIDKIESLATDPQQMHRVKICDRAVLAAMFEDEPEKYDYIMQAMPATYQDIGAGATAADLVKVTESWKLRSSKKAGDGVHVMCIDDMVLIKEEWDHDYFPFVFIHYSKNLFGFWGKGACERLESLQGEINRLMILDQRSRWMMSSFKILVENGSKVVSQHLNNEVGTIVHYTGTPPQYVTPPAIDPSNEMKIDSLIDKGFRQEGVSQLDASALKPMGLDSGKAIRTYNNIAEDRQLFQAQEMETFYLQCAAQMIDRAKDIYADRKTYSVVFPQGRFMETVDWKDIKLKEDEYVLKAFPVSSLAEDMSGRLQEVQELAQAGMISPRTARKLMRTPDLEMSDNLANASEDLLSKIIEEMIDCEEDEADEKYTAPEPYFDLTLAKQLVLEYYNYAMFQNAPRYVLDLLTKFNEQIDEITGVAAAPQPMALASGIAPAKPMEAPKSDLIPNIQGAA